MPPEAPAPSTGTAPRPATPDAELSRTLQLRINRDSMLAGSCRRPWLLLCRGLIEGLELKPVVVIDPRVAHRLGRDRRRELWCRPEGRRFVLVWREAAHPGALEVARWRRRLEGLERRFQPWITLVDAET